MVTKHFLTGVSPGAVLLITNRCDGQTWTRSSEFVEAADRTARLPTRALPTKNLRDDLASFRQANSARKVLLVRSFHRDAALISTFASLHCMSSHDLVWKCTCTAGFPTVSLSVGRLYAPQMRQRRVFGRLSQTKRGQTIPGRNRAPRRPTVAANGAQSQGQISTKGRALLALRRLLQPSDAGFRERPRDCHYSDSDASTEEAGSVHQCNGEQQPSLQPDSRSPVTRRGRGNRGQL